MSPTHPRRVHSNILLGCTGASVKIPKLHSQVYYFPLGHLHHASPSPTTHTLSILNRHRSIIPCLVSTVDLLADTHSDEVFAKLLLTPVTTFRLQEPQDHSVSDDADKVVSSVKILSQSDANNGGAFSVPRSCADTVFPKLNFEAVPPSQELFITDVHGEVWKFTHTFRGNPRRHLFTTGWSTFVNKKKLVAGDSVVFMKNSTGEIFVGIRRIMKFEATSAAEVSEENKEFEGFSRNGKRGKVTEQAVREAAESAEKKNAFEVVYYPSDGCWCDFVVDAKVVDEAMKIDWSCGMRVKLCLENDRDSSKMKLILGTISNVSTATPWRMLQVNWDGAEVSENLKQVSPWQVEVISQMPALHLAFPPTKKFRATHNSSGIEGSTTIEFLCSTAKSSNRTPLNYDTLDASIKGVRQNLLSVSDKGNSFIGVNSVAGLSIVSTELTLHSSISTNDSSSDTNISIDTKKATSPSIMLFGTIIQPVQCDFQDSGIKTSDDEIQDIHKACTNG